MKTSLQIQHENSVSSPSITLLNNSSWNTRFSDWADFNWFWTLASSNLCSWTTACFSSSSLRMRSSYFLNWFVIRDTSSVFNPFRDAISSTSCSYFWEAKKNDINVKFWFKLYDSNDITHVDYTLTILSLWKNAGGLVEGMKNDGTSSISRSSSSSSSSTVSNLRFTALEDWCKHLRFFSLHKNTNGYLESSYMNCSCFRDPRTYGLTWSIGPLPVLRFGDFVNPPSGETSVTESSKVAIIGEFCTIAGWIPIFDGLYFRGELALRNLYCRLPVGTNEMMSFSCSGTNTFLAMREEFINIPFVLCNEK